MSTDKEALLEANHDIGWGEGESNEEARWQGDSLGERAGESDDRRGERAGETEHFFESEFLGEKADDKLGFLDGVDDFEFLGDKEEIKPFSDEREIKSEERGTLEAS